MTNETIKAILMILMFGSLEAAIHVPKIWKSRNWTFPGRAAILVWPAIAVTGRVLQPAVPQRQTHERRPLR